MRYHTTQIDTATTAQKNEIVVKYHYLPVKYRHCAPPLLIISSTSPSVAARAGVLSTWTPRDASVSAHVIAACRGHAAEISFAGDVGLVSYELIGPVNPFACEVRFHIVFETKAAYETYTTLASVLKFKNLLEAQGADKPTLEYFEKVEQGNKYPANSRNMGLPLDVNRGIGIIATFNCKTPEIVQAAMKVVTTHFERQFSTEPYSTGYSILFDASKPNTFGEQAPCPDLSSSSLDQQPVHGVTLTPAVLHDPQCSTSCGRARWITGRPTRGTGSCRSSATSSTTQECASPRASA